MAASSDTPEKRVQDAQRCAQLCTAMDESIATMFRVKALANGAFMMISAGQGNADALMTAICDQMEKHYAEQIALMRTVTGGKPAAAKAKRKRRGGEPGIFNSVRDVLAEIDLDNDKQ